MVVFLVAFSVVLQILFLYGIYKENVGLSMTYCLIISLATILSIIKSIYDYHFWPSAVWFAITNLMSFIYIHHLCLVVQNRKNQEEADDAEENQY